MLTGRSDTLESFDCMCMPHIIEDDIQISPEQVT
jgi:hypothetical protein